MYWYFKNFHLKPLKNLEEASATIQFPHVFHPNETDHNMYMNYFAIFESLSSKLEEEFSRITLLQQLAWRNGIAGKAIVGSLVLNGASQIVAPFLKGCQPLQRPFK